MTDQDQRFVVTVSDHAPNPQAPADTGPRDGVARNGTGHDGTGHDGASHDGAGYDGLGYDGLGYEGGGQEAAGVDGQLIRTLTPELVDRTRTSSARPEITASPNPAGKADPPSWPMAS